MAEFMTDTDNLRIGVFVCSCGINIAGIVDVKAVVDYAKTLDHVAYVENNLFTCSADTQDLIAQKIGEQGGEVKAGTPAEFKTWLSKNIASFGAEIKAAGLKAE